MKKTQIILNKIDKIKKDMIALKEEGKINEAHEKIAEINNLKKEYDIAKEIEDMEHQEAEKNLNNDDEKNKKENSDIKNQRIKEIMAKALVGKAGREELEEISNLMEESIDKNGGLIVPEDVRTQIVELQRKSFDIRNYVNTEPVTTNKGSRPIEANEPTKTGFASIDEGKDIQELHEPEFKPLKFEVRKYAGFIPLTNELLEDTPENIMQFITKWMAKNEINTYNYQVFNGSGEDKAAEGIMTSKDLEDNKIKIETVPTVDSFKNIINEELDDIDTESICIFTNSKGYNCIDKMKNEKGEYYLQKDVTKKSGYVFLDQEIVKVPRKFLSDTKEGYTPFIICDPKLFYTLFDRKKMTIESTKIGGNAWRQDKTEIKGAFRFDGKLADTEACRILLAKIPDVVEISEATKNKNKNDEE